MELTNVLDSIVFVSSNDMTALLESGFLPRAVIDRVVARGHVPDTRLAPAGMVGQATCFINGCVVDIPGVYVVLVRSTAADFFQMVAELDVC